MAAIIPLPEIPSPHTGPYIIVNCACSADGKIALPDGRQTRISSDDDIAYVHRLRNWADAIIVGINTILMDNPKLTVKERFVSSPTHPLRVVVDSQGRTPERSLVLNDCAQTVIAVLEGTEFMFDLPENVSVIKCGNGDQVDLAALINTLHGRGITRIMVEGGGTLISSFLREGLVHEFQIFIGDMIIGGEGAPTPVMGSGACDFSEIQTLRRISSHEMEGGIRIHYQTSLKSQMMVETIND